MNKLHFLKFACISGMLLFTTFYSCNKTDESQGSSADEPTRREAKNVDVSGLNTNASAYFANIKTAIFATGSNLPVTRSESQYEENPLIEKLQSMQIVEEETSRDMSFFEMSAEEQEAFLDEWAVLQSEQLSEKIKNAPELEEAVKAENEVVAEVLNEEVQPLVRGGKGRVKDNKVFFAKIKERFAAKAEEFESRQQPETKLISYSPNTNNSIHFTQLRGALRAHARRGDFLLALPKHGATNVYLNIGSDFAVGHAGVITNIPAANATVDIKISVGAQGNGVVEESLNYWSNKCYIMGVRQVKWVWRWRGFRSGLYREIRHMDPAPLASWAESFRGRPYVYVHEFLTAKWAAPSRFTCTTLVWWCAKKAYGVNVSAWWATMVSPTGLFTDESVCERCDVSRFPAS